MSAALGSVLAVDKGVELLAHLRCMGDDHLDVVALEVHGLVERVVGHVLLHQVEQAVARVVALAVVDEREASVEEGVVFHHCLDNVVVELVVFENRIVGGEFHQRAVFLVGAGIDDARLALDQALAVGHGSTLAIAHTANVEVRRQCIDSLDTHTIQAHRALVVLGVILGAGIHLARGISHLVEGDTAAIVAYCHGTVGHINFNQGLGKPRVVLIDAVVDHLLHEHVDAVVALAAVAQLAYVHAWPQPDVLAGSERHQLVVATEVARLLNALFVLVQFQFFFHLT